MFRSLRLPGLADAGAGAGSGRSAVHIVSSPRPSPSPTPIPTPNSADQNHAMPCHAVPYHPIPSHTQPTAQPAPRVVAALTDTIDASLARAALPASSYAMYREPPVHVPSQRCFCFTECTSQPLSESLGQDGLQHPALFRTKTCRCRPRPAVQHAASCWRLAARWH